MVESRVTQHKAQKDFYWHMTVYLIVNAGLVVVNLATSSDTIWFIWPLLGWGIGLLLHALSVFVFKDWSDAEAGE